MNISTIESKLQLSIIKKRFLFTIFFQIYLFSFTTPNLFAQSPALHYADSLVQTAEGEDMYEFFLMNAQVEDTTSQSMHNFALIFTRNYFIKQYYNLHPPLNDVAYSLCYNSDFSLNEQNDTTLNGYQMFSGERDSILNYRDLQVNAELPLNKIPTNQVLSSILFNDDRFDFDLNPNNNLLEFNLEPLDFVSYLFANYRTFELMNGESDLTLPDLVRTNPPSGQTAIKINNNDVNFRISKLSKKFYTSPGDSVFHFSTSLVMENPQPSTMGEHVSAEQPFFLARLLDSNGNQLDSIIHIADTSDQFFKYYVSGASTPIVYSDWKCESFDLRPHLLSNDTFTVEFYAADCGEGAHFGYAYLSFCESCEYFPSIGLDTVTIECLPSNFNICGSFNIDTNIFEIIDLQYEFVSNNIIVSQKDVENSDIDKLTGTFCSEVNQMFDELIETLCFDVFAVMRLVNPNGDTITLRSPSIIPNSQSNMDNDFCSSIPFCCPNDTLMINLDSTICLGGISIGEANFEMNFTIDSLDFAAGYYIPLDQDLLLVGGYMENLTIIKVPINQYDFTGIIHITDSAFVFGPDSILYGTINYTNGIDTCVLTLSFTFDTELKCVGCLNDTLMVDVNGSECLGGEGILQTIFNLHFVIDTSDLEPGYVIPLDQPFVINGGYIENFELDLLNGSEYIGTGILHVTDLDFVLGADPSVYGSLFYVKGTDTCELVVVLPFFWYNLKCDDETILCENLILDVRADTSYLGGVPYQVTISIDVVFPFFETDSCELTEWNVEANRIDGGIYYPISPNYEYDAPYLPYDSTATLTYVLSYASFNSMSSLDIGFMNNCLGKTWCYAEVDPDEWLDVDSSGSICDGLVRPALFSSVIRDSRGNITHHITNYTLDLPFIELEEDCEITTWYLTVTWRDTLNGLHSHSTYTFANSTTFPANLPLTFAINDWGKLSSIKFVLTSNCETYCEYIHYLGGWSFRKAGSNEVALKESISLFPNPTNEYLKIKLENSYENGQIEILDLKGRLVQKLTVNNEEKTNLSIDVTEYISGVYMIRWTSKGNTLVKSFTVVK